MDQTYMLLVAVLAALVVLAAIGMGLILFSFFLMMQAKKAKTGRAAAREAAAASLPAAAPAASAAPPPTPAPRPQLSPQPMVPSLPPDPSTSGMRRPVRGAGFAEDDELQATVVMAAGAASWLDDSADGEARTEVLDRSREAMSDTTPVKGTPDFGFLDE